MQAEQRISARRRGRRTPCAALLGTKIPSRDGKGLYRARLVEERARVGEA